MHFFGMIFWLAVLWFAFGVWRRHSWHWAMTGPRGYAPWWYHRDRYESTRGMEARRPERDDQQAYIDALETRVSELEERLDFTERLVAGRGEPGSPG